MDKLAKKAINFYTEKVQQQTDEVPFPDTQYFKKSFMGLKRIIDMMFEIHENSEEYVTNFLKVYIC
jgi:hypothetical protein